MASVEEKPTPPMDVEKEAVGVDRVQSEASVDMPKGITEKILKHSHDADTAMKAFESMGGQVIELTEEKSKALLRKIDLHLMPVSSQLFYSQTGRMHSC
jgi:ACS family allantoate permease-like MFS transporter